MGLQHASARRCRCCAGASLVGNGPGNPGPARRLGAMVPITKGERHGHLRGCHGHRDPGMREGHRPHPPPAEVFSAPTRTPAEPEADVRRRVNEVIAGQCGQWFGCEAAKIALWSERTDRPTCPGRATTTKDAIRGVSWKPSPVQDDALHFVHIEKYEIEAARPSWA